MIGEQNWIESELLPMLDERGELDVSRDVLFTDVRIRIRTLGVLVITEQGAVAVVRCEIFVTFPKLSSSSFRT